MEPASISIVAALVAGATATLKDVATDAIKDAYAGLKRLIADRYQAAGALLEAVEEDPEDSAEHQVLGKRLDKAGAANDDELKSAAQVLLDALQELRGQPDARALFDFDKLRLAGSIELEDIDLVGGLLHAREADITGDLKAKGIRQTRPGDGAKK